MLRTVLATSVAKACLGDSCCAVLIVCLDGLCYAVSVSNLICKVLTLTIQASLIVLQLWAPACACMALARPCIAGIFHA
jgi:hypothetical protein